MGDSLTLKWGTLKGWNAESVAVIAAGQKLFDLSPRSMSAMLQEDTLEQKRALCEWIDAVANAGGEIWNDWDGAKMTAEEARRYVMDYGS